MREIVVRNGKVFYKDELQQEGGRPKPEMSLRHIQLDKQGLDTYLHEMIGKDIKFISLSAKIYGKNATYDILLKETQLPNKVTKPAELKVEDKLNKTVENKAKFELEEGVFLAFTGTKMQPGDFFFEKVLLDGEVVELPINVVKVVDYGLYQIIYDSDGSWGYNV